MRMGTDSCNNLYSTNSSTSLIHNSSTFKSTWRLEHTRSVYISKKNKKSNKCGVSNVVKGTDRLKSLPAYIKSDFLHTLSDHHTLILFLRSINYSACGNELVASVHQPGLISISTRDHFTHKHSSEFVFFKSNAWNTTLISESEWLPSPEPACSDRTWHNPKHINFQVCCGNLNCLDYSSLRTGIPNGFLSSTLIRLHPAGGRSFSSSLALADEFVSELKMAFKECKFVHWLAHTPYPESECLPVPEQQHTSGA